MAERWRRCSACKSDIALGAIYWVCSVSTCNRKRTGLVFCNVDCWEIHLPTERHREAWAVEKRAPATPDPVEPAAPKTPRARPERSSGTKLEPPARPRVIVRRSADAGARPAASASGPKAPAAPATRTAPASSAGEASASKDVLVVASKLKAYVREVSGFNTSDRVLPLLSDALRAICDEAIRNARRAERQTVMDRDVPRS